MAKRDDPVSLPVVCQIQGTSTFAGQVTSYGGMAYICLKSNVEFIECTINFNLAVSASNLLHRRQGLVYLMLFGCVSQSMGGVVLVNTEAHVLFTGSELFANEAVSKETCHASLVARSWGLLLRNPFTSVQIGVDLINKNWVDNSTYPWTVWPVPCGCD